MPPRKESGLPSGCNEEYFDQIDSPNKAYLLGFITADGAVTCKNGIPRNCSIEIRDDDKDLVLFARQEINPNVAITECNYKQKHNVRVTFSSKKMCSSLAQYGIVPNKSKIIEKVPVELIPKELLRFYFRGLIDGDGCVHKKGQVSIYSGSYKFIESVQQTLIDETGVTKLGIYHGTSYFITWNSIADRQKLFHYLYDDLDATFYYKRKYKRLYNSLYGNTELTN